MISPIPANIDCRIANPELWEVFKNSFENIYFVFPTAFWTEEQVIQWLDFNDPETVKRLRETEK